MGDEQNMLTPGGILIRNPRLMFNTDDENGGGGNQQQEQQNEPAFPANTPVSEMTPDQAIAYWTDKARKHEGRVKAYGDLTPEQAREVIAERDRLKNEKLTADERAIEAAKAEGATPWKTALATERVNNALERALTGRSLNAVSALLELDRSQFISADTATANAEAIKTWVEANSTPASTGAQKKNPALGQGRERGSDGPSRGADAGRDLFAARHKTFKQS